MKKLIITAAILVATQSAHAQFPLLNSNQKNAMYHAEEKKIMRDKNFLSREDSMDLKANIEAATNAKSKKLTEFDLFRPGRIKELNNQIYDNPKTINLLESFSIQTIGDGTYISSELVNAFFGAVRFGLGGSFKTTGDSTKDEAIKNNLQKIMTAGGSINSTFTMPVYFTRKPNDELHFGAFLMTNWAITPKNLDTAQAGLTMSSEFNFNNQSGFLLHFDVTSKDRNVALYTDVKATYNWGNTLTEKLQMTDYSLIDMRVGVKVKDLISLYISGPLYSTSSKVLSVPFLLNLQFSPNKIAKGVNEE